MQYAELLGIVVYGGGDIVFDTKRSNQWMQWTQYTVVSPFCTKDNVPTTIYHYSTASTAYCVLRTVSTASTGLTFSYQRQYPHHHIPLFHCIHCVLHPLCTASAASTGLTILHQRQCPHHYIPLFHYVHCILCPLNTVSTAYCIHTIESPLCNSYTT